MPLTAYRTHRSRLRLCASLAVGMLPVALGLMFLYAQAGIVLRDISRTSAADAVRQIDLMLDNASQAAGEVLPQVGRPCAEVELVLREQVATVPFVRSVNLMDGGGCTAHRCSARSRSRSTLLPT